MSLSKFIWGILLVLVGLIYLGINFNFLPNDFLIQILKYWPIILIGGGLSMIASNKTINSIIWLLVFAILIALALSQTDSGSGKKIRELYQEQMKKYCREIN